MSHLQDPRMNSWTWSQKTFHLLRTSSILSHLPSKGMTCWQKADSAKKVISSAIASKLKCLQSCLTVIRSFIDATIWLNGMVDWKKYNIKFETSSHALNSNRILNSTFKTRKYFELSRDRLCFIVERHVMHEPCPEKCRHFERTSALVFKRKINVDISKVDVFWSTFERNVDIFSCMGWVSPAAWRKALRIKLWFQTFLKMWSGHFYSVYTTPQK